MPVIDMVNIRHRVTPLTELLYGLIIDGAAIIKDL